MPMLTLGFADLRSGLRTLRTYPMLSSVAIVTFGLGLGISTTVFSITNGALFKGLPFEEPDRVVAVYNVKADEPDDTRPVPVQDLRVWQTRQTVFDGIGAYDSASVNLSAEAGEPQRVSAGLLTVAAFQILKVKPVLGRGFEPGDDQFGAPAVMLLGDSVWREHFGSATDVVDRLVRANGVPRRVIGVMPAKFGFPELESLWLPLQYNPDATPRDKGPNYSVIARLKPGVSLTRAQAEVGGFAANLAEQFPQANRGVSAEVEPYARAMLGREVYALLYTMLGAGIGVLLIACVNVSNLLIARASLRRREVAVRMALGASRVQVVRQHLTEVLVLAGIGGAIGVAIGVLGVRWFTDALSADPPPFWITFDVDWRVVLFVAAAIVLAAMLAGTLPALHASRTSPGAVLKDDSRSSTSARLGRFSGLLVVAELAISCGLLIAAGLMIKSVAQMRFVTLPFAVDNVLTMVVDLPATQYPDAASHVRFCEELLPRLSAIAGVQAAALADNLPGLGTGADAMQVEGRVYPRDIDYPTVRRAQVTPGYFETFQVPILRGRGFAASDDKKGQRVAVVNDTLARQIFGDTNPIGQRIRSGRANSTAPWLTIVGVVPDLGMQGFGNASASGEGYYVPIAQSDIGSVLEIIVRSHEHVEALTTLVRSAVAAVDRDQPIFGVHTMAQIMWLQRMYYNIFGVLFVAFGAVALFLAAAGLYGVMSFAVTGRTREMGVRSALGASGPRLVALVMRRSVIQVGVGLVLGLGLGLAASSPLEPVLYRVNPRDPVVVSLVVFVLAIVALAASALPAWRVTKIDPVTALTTE